MKHNNEIFKQLGSTIYCISILNYIFMCMPIFIYVCVHLCTICCIYMHVYQRPTNIEGYNLIFGCDFPFHYHVMAYELKLWIFQHNQLHNLQCNPKQVFWTR